MDLDRYKFFKGVGPVLATAVHSGHSVRDELQSLYRLSSSQRRREEDPMTENLALVGDHVFINRVSRFEVDLNRIKEKAIYLEPNDAWGLDVWKSKPSELQVSNSLQYYDHFYEMMKTHLDQMIKQHGKVILLDFHSYNHRRAGPDEAFAPDISNPDIDLGITTANLSIFSSVVSAFTQGLQQTLSNGRKLSVGNNIRYPDGGQWPEWVFENYPDQVCSITLEYKKFFMDEWADQVDLNILEELRTGLEKATLSAKEAL